ncbi:MAG: DUF1488 family protein [Thermoanaerobaculia bacterium]
MNITFREQFYWADGLLRGVASSATVDDKVVPFILEGRALAEYFGVEDKQWPIEVAYMRNRAFLEEIVRDAIERGMFNRWGEVLLGKRELTPYFEKRAASAPA